MTCRSRISIKLVCLSFLALCGCQTTRYVTTPCLTQEQLDEQRKAEPPKVGDKLTGKADEDIKPISGSNVRLRAWGHGLLTILDGCAS